MNLIHIDDDGEDYNFEALARSADDIADRAAAARDHIGAAQRDIRRCMDISTDARLDGGALSGRKLDDLLSFLIEIEGDLSRADGELAG